MKIQKDDVDIVSMKKLENLSKNISDLINVGKYEAIPKLDNKRLELIRGFYEKLKIGGTMLIDICGSEDNPSELSDSDFELLSYISKKLRNTDKLIKKNYNPEIELLDQKPTEKDLEIIRRIKNIDTYSLFVKKTKEKILI